MKVGEKINVSGFGEGKITQILETAPNYTKVMLQFEGRDNLIRYTVFKPLDETVVADDGLDEKIARQEAAVIKRANRKKAKKEEEEKNFEQDE